LAKVYNISGNYSTALGYFGQCRKIADKINNLELQITANSNIGGIYMIMEKYSHAITTLLKSFRTNDEISNTTGLIFLIINISKYYIHLGNFRMAFNTVERAEKLSKSPPDTAEVLMKIYSTYTDIYHKKSDYQKAFYYLKKYYVLNSEVINESDKKYYRTSDKIRIGNEGKRGSAF